MSSKTKEENKIGIVELPQELLAHIFEFLAPEEISKLSEVCKAFYSTSQIDSIWKKKCSELPIPRFSIQNGGLSFRQIYTKVLHKYWKLLGFWRRNVTFYGGFLHVKFDSANGTIIGTEWNPSDYFNVRGPMSGTAAFRVDPHESKKASRLPICGPPDSVSQQHCCQIALGNSEDVKVLEFQTECMTPDLHHGPDEVGMLYMPPDLRLMILRKSQYRHKYDYTRLDWPLPMPGAIIQPGLFKGDFSNHGVELIMLTYVDDRTVEGIKVTGDPCIPFGQVTFRANLLEAFVLNFEEQGCYTVALTAEPLSPPIPPNQLPQQPFRIPDQLIPYGNDLPNVCKARFSGVGQDASEGFTDSSFLRGHWVVFNEDLFAFVWVTLYVFHRVKEEF